MQLSTLLDKNAGTPTSRPLEARATAPAGRPTTAPASRVTTAPGSTPCQEYADADLWFAERTADLERAKVLCGACPVRRECLIGALRRGEPWGVWGGEVLVDGVVVARKRGRGRPRKDETAA